ncbi:MAG: hypothetical protein ACXU89_07175 [Xanthobacteraceae bacterium]
MKTYSLNSLAESFEIDRSTMVRALKNTLPDAEVTRGRPTWKISSAARALEQHRRKTGNSAGNSDSARDGYNPIDPKLQSLYSQLDIAEATLRALQTLAKRRAFAITSLRPIIDAAQRMQHVVGEVNGQDPEVTGLFSDKLYMLALRGLEKPCGWTQSETWNAMNVVAGRD